MEIEPYSYLLKVVFVRWQYKERKAQVPLLGYGGTGRWPVRTRSARGKLIFAFHSGFCKCLRFADSFGIAKS